MKKILVCAFSLVMLFALSAQIAFANEKDTKLLWEFSWYDKFFVVQDDSKWGAIDSNNDGVADKVGNVVAYFEFLLPDSIPETLKSENFDVTIGDTDYLIYNFNDYIEGMKGQIPDVFYRQLFSAVTSGEYNSTYLYLRDNAPYFFNIHSVVLGVVHKNSIEFIPGSGGQPHRLKFRAMLLIDPYNAIDAKNFSENSAKLNGLTWFVPLTVRVYE